MNRIFIGSVLALLSASTSAQTTPSSSSVQAVTPATRVMPANTLITVTPTSEITSKHVKVGDKVNFTTIGDVTEQGTVVIPRGSMVTGEITFKTGKAVGGKSGKFEVAFRTVQVRGQDYPLTGVHRQEGKGNTVAAVFASLIISGRSAVMLVGQEAKAFTGAQIPY